MRPETIRILNGINERFYAERASEFSATREQPWRGWDELFDRIERRLAPSPVVLDVGCGNGRFARFLEKRLDGRFRYWGVDASPLALDEARSRLAHLEPVQLVEHDFVTAPQVLPFERFDFDLVALFGVLHHVPGRENRHRILKELATRVGVGGMLVYAVWRFDRFERFLKKLVPWELFCKKTGVAVDLNDLEPGDHVMTWGDREPTYRYCHAMSDDEREELRRALPLERIASFDADGDLNRYEVYAAFR